MSVVRYLDSLVAATTILLIIVPGGNSGCVRFLFDPTVVHSGGENCVARGVPMCYGDCVTDFKYTIEKTAASSTDSTAARTYCDISVNGCMATSYTYKSYTLECDNNVQIAGVYLKVPTTSGCSCSSRLSDHLPSGTSNCPKYYAPQPP